MTLRRQPEDFRVVEHLAPPTLDLLRPNHPAPVHAVYRVTKTSLTTPEVSTMLEKALKSAGFRTSNTQHAGLKDKHAHTTQHISLQINPSDIPPLPRLPANLSAHNWSAELVGTLPRALTAHDILHNHFTITVRALSTQRCEEIARTAQRFHHPAHENTLLIPNYFGEQRFGSARHEQGWIAHALVKGDFELALKLAIATPARKDTGARRTLTRALIQHWNNWTTALPLIPRCPERACVELLAKEPTNPNRFRDAFAALPHFVQQISVDAFQSMLFNQALANLIRTATPAEDHAHLTTLSTPFGDLLFPPASRITDPDLLLPLPAPNMPPTSLAWQAAITAALSPFALKPEELTIPGLRRPSFHASTRPAFMLASNFHVSQPLPDELAAPRSPLNRKLIATFTLPRGSYATVLFRALGE